MASEFLSESIYPEGHPIDHLELAQVLKIGGSKKEKAEAMKKFKEQYLISPGVEIIHSSRFKKEMKKAYPEQKIDLKYRTLKVHEMMLERVV